VATILALLAASVAALVLAASVAGCVEGPGAEEQVDYLPADFGDAYGYVDADGKTVIPPQFDNAELFSGSRALVTVADKYSYVDKTGTLVTPLFDGAWTFSQGLAAVRVGGERGYIDRSGKIVIEPRFEVAGSFSEGLAPVRVDGEWGYVDTSGKMIIEPRFDLAWEFYEDRALVVVDGRKGFIDLDGRVVVSPQYADAWRFSEGLAGVKTGTKWGFIDPSGRMVIQPGFDDAWWFSEGLAPVRVGSKWGYINTKGKLVIEPQYDTAYRFSQGRAVVRVGDLEGYIDKSGATIVAPKYQFAWAFLRDRALVRNNGIDKYLDRDGTKIWSAAAPAAAPEVETEGAAPLPPASTVDQAKPPIGLIVFDGDSLTIGTQATDPYPSQLMRMWGGGVRWWNLGVGGQGVADMLGDAAEQVDTKYDARRGRNVVVLWGGTNDMALRLRSPQQVLELTRQYCEERRDQGFLMVVTTTLPRSGRIDPDDFEGRRQDLNALLRAQWRDFADALVDVAADPRLGDPGDEMDRRYFDADRVHLNDTGLGEIAKLVYPALKGL
jgi:lysophospholipase L1-like esterase